MVKLYMQFGASDRLGRDPENEQIFFIEKVFCRSEEADDWAECFTGTTFRSHPVSVQLALQSILADGPASKRGRKSGGGFGGRGGPQGFRF